MSILWGDEVLKVLLASPYMLRTDPPERRGMKPFAPLGPLYIGAVLKEAGHDVRFFDATFEKDLSGFEEMLGSWKPDIAGVYSTFLSKAGALRMGDMARQRGIFAVAGGPESSVNFEQYLDGHFNAVVVGEGESTAVELLAAVEKGPELAGIPGLVIMSKGKPVATQKREMVPDIDNIPFPLRAMADFEPYRKAWTARHGFFAMNVMASRGCPFDCDFCSRPVFGRSHRTRTVGKVMDEITLVVDKYRPQRIRFSDDILPLNRKWTLELCGAIRDSGLDIGFECLARMDLMDRELLAVMGKAGFKKIYYGVESGSQRVLDAMCKGTDVENIPKIARLTRDAGIEQHWFMMLGYPGERQADVEKTIALMTGSLPEEFSTTLANPMRGTPLHSRTPQDSNTGIGGRRFRYLWNNFRMHAQMRLARSLGKANPLGKGATGILRCISSAMAGREG